MICSRIRWRASCSPTSHPGPVASSLWKFPCWDAPDANLAGSTFFCPIGPTSSTTTGIPSVERSSNPSSILADLPTEVIEPSAPMPGSGKVSPIFFCCSAGQYVASVPEERAVFVAACHEKPQVRFVKSRLTDSSSPKTLSISANSIFPFWEGIPKAFCSTLEAGAKVCVGTVIIAIFLIGSSAGLFGRLAQAGRQPVPLLPVWSSFDREFPEPCCQSDCPLSIPLYLRPLNYIVSPGC